MTRIKNAGGKVSKLTTNMGEEYGPYRVWLKDVKSPGLAVSRSFGDIVATTIGVISEPDVYEIRVKPEDRVLVIATDGVWDKLNNEEVGEIVLGHECVDTAMNEVVVRARRKWEETGPIVDDISCIIIQLNSIS